MLDHDNLEEFQDPANYDLEEADDAALTSRFYAGLAGDSAQTVLDVACGSGLVTIALALQGLQMTGVDMSVPMLKHARRKALRLNLSIDWIAADARCFALARRFDMILMSGNAFQAFLTRADQVALLQGLRRHLKAGAMLAFETRNPAGTDLSTRPREPWFDYTDVAGRTVKVSGSQCYDADTRIMHWTTYRTRPGAAGNDESVTRIACRFTTSDALTALLEEQGFEVQQQFGDWDGSRFEPDSPSIISVCRC